MDSIETVVESGNKTLPKINKPKFFSKAAWKEVPGAVDFRTYSPREVAIHTYSSLTSWFGATIVNNLGAIFSAIGSTVAAHFPYFTAGVKAVWGKMVMFGAATIEAAVNSH